MYFSKHDDLDRSTAVSDMRSGEQVTAAGHSFWTRLLQDPCHPHHHHQSVPPQSSDSTSPSDLPNYPLISDLSFPSPPKYRNSQLPHQQHQHQQQQSLIRPRAAKRRASFESLPSQQSSFMRSLPKQSRPLQLPPFDSLGINIPTPAVSSKEELVKSPSRPLLRVSTSAPIASDTPPGAPSSLSYKSPLPLTPPDDVHEIQWDTNSTSNPNLSPVSDPRSIPDPAASVPAKNLINHKPLASDRSNGHTETASSQSIMISNGSINGVGPTGGNQSTTEGTTTFWLEDGISIAVSSLPISKTRGEAVQMVSQTLPCPSPSSPSTSPKPAFGSIIQTIQRNLQPGQSPYVRIAHAVPPGFSLSSLPTSPPGTPNLLLPGDDYFNETVFPSAVPVPTYSSPELTGKASAGTLCPTPILPPHSVHVSVVERYLPPTTIGEYRDLFSPTGPSVLVDRLLELSAKSGSLVFMYPTRKGGQAFKNSYLGPALDPLLRQLVVLDGLSADVGSAMGVMQSVAHMDDFEGIRDNIFRLCYKLSKREAETGQQTGSGSSRFSLVYSGKGEVQMDWKSWTEWYSQQESPRLKNILNVCFDKGLNFPSKELASPGGRTSGIRDVTPTMMLLDILDKVRQRAADAEKFEPPFGMEIGMFVIRRSH